MLEHSPAWQGRLRTGEGDKPLPRPPPRGWPSRVRKAARICAPYFGECLTPCSTPARAWYTPAQERPAMRFQPKGDKRKTCVEECAVFDVRGIAPVRPCVAVQVYHVVAGQPYTPTVRLTTTPTF